MKNISLKINQYEQAIDDELVNCFLGTKDDFKDAKSALLAIIDWNCKVALDPAVSEDANNLFILGCLIHNQKPIAYALENKKEVILFDDYQECLIASVKVGGFCRPVGFLDFPKSKHF